MRHTADEEAIVPNEQSPKWNVKRGLIRLWLLFSLVWLAAVGGIWVSIWSNQLAERGQALISSLTPAPNYETLCARLRAQRATGGPVDAIPAIPALELVVEKGVGRVIAAPGRCLVVFAKEEGINLVPVAFKIVGGDGSSLREIEDRSGKRRPITDFPSVPPIESMASNSNPRPMFEGLAFVVGVPAVLFGLGASIRWAAIGFRGRD